jgi:hypothetical protein
VSDRIRPFADIPTIKQTVAMAHRTSLTGTFALLCASAAAAQTIPLASTVQSSPPTLPSRDEAKRAVVTCGLPGNRVSVRYEPDMQEDVVWIAHRGKPLSEATLTCVARASLTTTYYLYFRDQPENQRFWRIYGEISEEVEVANARSWLRERNMLLTAPVPIAGKPLADFATDVEGFCGVKAGTLLVARDEHMITFAQGGLGRITEEGLKDAAASTEQFECVMRVMASADLKPKGLFFGFIGNAAAADR